MLYLAVNFNLVSGLNVGRDGQDSRKNRTHWNWRDSSPRHAEYWSKIKLNHVLLGLIALLYVYIQCVYIQTPVINPYTSHTFPFIERSASKLTEGDINQASSVNAIFDSPRPVMEGCLLRSDSFQTRTPWVMCSEKCPEWVWAAFFSRSGNTLAPNPPCKALCVLRMTHEAASSPKCEAWLQRVDAMHCSVFIRL